MSSACDVTELRSSKFCGNGSVRACIGDKGPSQTAGCGSQVGLLSTSIPPHLKSTSFRDAFHSTANLLHAVTITARANVFRMSSVEMAFFFLHHVGQNRTKSPHLISGKGNCIASLIYGHGDHSLCFVEVQLCAFQFVTLTTNFPFS